MFIDITQDLCPMTFVKTKLAIEQLKDGEELIVILKEGEPLENVPKSVLDLGYYVKKIEDKGGGIYSLTIIKNTTSNYSP